jgi:ribose transport system substrate-binding protein
MKRLAILFAPVMALVVALCTAGCSAGADSDRPEIAVVTPYLANAATKDVITKFQRKAEAKGWSVTVTDTAGDFDRLNSEIQNAAARAPKAIVLGMGDPEQMGLGLRAAKDAGVPVFGIDVGLADGIAANVTSDNDDLGRKSAQALIDTVGHGAKILMFTHDPHPGVRARTAAARKVLAAAGIVVVESRHVEVPGPVEDAKKSMQDFLTAHPDPKAITGVWAGWDEPAFGATQAIVEAGRTGIAVVGVDGEDFALAEIRKGGPFKATVRQDWDAIADRAVALVDDSLHGRKPAEREYRLPGQVLTG